MNHNEGCDSPIASDRIVQQTPAQIQNQVQERTTNKRPRSNFSPHLQQPGLSHRQDVSLQQRMTHQPTITKISFPPIIISFKGNQGSSVKDITDDLVSKWKIQHGIDLVLTARYGHMQSLLIFADDSSTFESLLDPNRWPRDLKEKEFIVKLPRQLPPEYSLIIQQFHRNWNEEEWLVELQQRYVSLFKLTRMKVKDGSPLNAVRADFKSIDEVKTLIRSGKINIGSMIHPVKPYYLPIRINKCLKCLKHDHTTSSCSLPRLCPRCAQQHSLENGCPNKEMCANCQGDHASGHSACPVVQEKRRLLLEQHKNQRAELLVLAERQQHRISQRPNDYPSQDNHIPLPPPTQSINQAVDPSRHSYSQAVNQGRNQAPQQNIENILSSFLSQMNHRLEEFSLRLTSQLCEIEKKLISLTDQQAKAEKLIYETILPSIQVLCGIAAQPSKKKLQVQDELNKVCKEIMSVMKGHKQRHDKQNHSLSAVRSLSAFDDDSN